MKNYLFAFALMLPAASNAGGFDISGNAGSLRDLIAQAESNCSVIRSVKLGVANHMACPNNKVGCNYPISSLKASNVLFDDKAIKNIIPISYKPPENCAQPCSKRLLTFVTRVQGKLIIDTREVDVDDHWAHENVVGIQWKGTDNTTFKVTKFEPASFSTKISDAEEDALVNTIQKTGNKEDLKDLSCETASAGGGGVPNAETRSFK